MTSPPKGRIPWVGDVSWEGLAAHWQRGSECRGRGKGRGWMQAERLGMPRLSQGSHAADTGLAAGPSSGVSAKGMSWPRSASLVDIKHLKCRPIACQLLPSQFSVLWRAHSKETCDPGKFTLCQVRTTPRSNLRVSCRTEKWAFNGTSSKRETLISSPLSCYSGPCIWICKAGQYLIHAAFCSVFASGLSTFSSFLCSRHHTPAWQREMGVDEILK